MTNQSDGLGPAIITGAAKGIGLAIASRFASDGRPVALWDVDDDALDAAADQVAALGGGAVTAQHADITSPESVRAAFEASVERIGAPTTLVNNAGILGWRGPVQDLPLERWHQVMAINLTGALICAQAVLPGMIERGYGRIVNMASIAGKDGNAFNAGYSASKAGLIALTKSMGKELGASGVLVNCVTPSAADTTIFDHQSPEERDAMRRRLLSLVPLGRYVEVEEIAELVAWLSSPRCSFSTGATFDITGGRSVY